MAIRLEGNFETHRTPDEVYELLTDPDKFARLLPNFQGITRQDATHFTVRVDSGMP
jgi:carbon monoxide dehydrogenase subunit G